MLQAKKAVIKHAVTMGGVGMLLCIGMLIYVGRGYRAGLGQGTDAVLIGFPDRLIQPVIRQIPAMLMGALPDGVWMAAFILTLLWIWDFRLQGDCLSWCFTALLLGISLELGQQAGIVPGSFDVYDLVCLALGGVLPIFILFLKRQLWKGY